MLYSLSLLLSSKILFSKTRVILLVDGVGMMLFFRMVFRFSTRLDPLSSVISYFFPAMVLTTILNWSPDRAPKKCPDDMA